MQKNNQKKENSKDDLRAYRIGPLTLLQFMAILAVLGILLAWVLQSFFM